MVTTPPDQPVEDWASSRCSPACASFPVRVKCASLAWHTLKAALEREPKRLDRMAKHEDRCR